MAFSIPWARCSCTRNMDTRASYMGCGLHPTLSPRLTPPALSHSALLRREDQGLYPALPRRKDQGFYPVLPRREDQRFYPALQSPKSKPFPFLSPGQPVRLVSYASGGGRHVSKQMRDSAAEESRFVCRQIIACRHCTCPRFEGCSSALLLC